jgi:hypothetical protein
VRTTRQSTPRKTARRAPAVRRATPSEAHQGDFYERYVTLSTVFLCLLPDPTDKTIDGERFIVVSLPDARGRTWIFAKGRLTERQRAAWRGRGKKIPCPMRLMARFMTEKEKLFENYAEPSRHLGGDHQGWWSGVTSITTTTDQIPFSRSECRKNEMRPGPDPASVARGPFNAVPLPQRGRRGVILRIFLPRLRWDCRTRSQTVVD